MSDPGRPNETKGELGGLIARARAGDARAVEELFRRCRAYLIVLARARSPDWLQAKVDASDIVQETLLAAHRDLPCFRGETSAEWLAWLRTALGHQIAAAIRRYAGTQKRELRRERPLDPPLNSLSSIPGSLQLVKGETPSQVLMARERELAVAEALLRLSPEHQEVIVLRNLQCLPFDEIARRMGRSRPAVQMLWMRAIRKLREVLASNV